jgi:hypothetical protein
MSSSRHSCKQTLFYRIWHLIYAFREQFKLFLEQFYPFFPITGYLDVKVRPFPIIDLFNNHLNQPVIVYEATHQSHSQRMSIMPMAPPAKDMTYSWMFLSCQLIGSITTPLRVSAVLYAFSSSVSCCFAVEQRGIAQTRCLWK